MSHLFNQRRSQWTVALLVAAAPLWCCCQALLVEAHAASTEPETCCPMSDRPDRPTGEHPDQPSSDCDCEYEGVAWALPGAGSLAQLAAIEWDAVAGHAVRPGDDADRGQAFLADATAGAPPPGRDSLYALRCLLLI